MVCAYACGIRVRGDFDGTASRAAQARALCETRAAELQPQRALLLFSLGCARLVHNARRDEDQLIDELLRGSLALFEEVEDPIGRAKVFNALGTLRMKARRYADAERYMRLMVDLRARHLPKSDPDYAQGYAQRRGSHSGLC